MTEQFVDMGFVSAPPSEPAQPLAEAAAAPPSQQPVDRTRGHSPARDRLEQTGAGDTERKVSVGGKEYAEREISDLLADKVQRDLAKAGLPASPDKYEARLPENFKAPEGMQFELNAEDPAFRQFREIAHRRGLDQDTFSEALGVYASVKVAELSQINHARQVQLDALGAAGQARIDAIETWLTAKVGDKAVVMISTLKNFPVAANVEAFEGIIRAFTSQGGSAFSQSHRAEQDPSGTIAGFEGMSFEQRRYAQDQKLAARNR